MHLMLLFMFRHLAALFSLVLSLAAHAQPTQQVIDLPTRPGVSLRMLVLEPPEPKAAVVLLAGGHGGLQIFPNGSMKWGDGNFVVRTRQLFAEQGLLVAVVDAPSDRLSPPYLGAFRQTPEHVADIQAVIAWLRQRSRVPVWLVGTSRGTQSAAHVAIEAQGPAGPDGVVLTATILKDDKAGAVPAMALDRIRVPVLVVHHEQDGCSLCPYAEAPALMARLGNAPRSRLLSFAGGQSRGDPCQAFAHHGFNGIEADVVRQVAQWMLAR